MREPKRVIVEVGDELHRRAKVEAAARGVTLSDIMRAALREFVEGKPKRGKSRREVSIDKH